MTPPAHAGEPGAEAALVEVVRGRLEGSGPLTALSLAGSVGLPVAQIDAALTTLQAEGFAMRGAFTAAAAAASEWCERRLLARIHRYTVKRLRAEIEPIEARDFLRFLFAWQRVTPETRMEGPDSVGAVLAQLEGFESPASAWETEVLPQRISEYEPAWLDEQCLAGRFVWTRLAPRRADPERGAAPVRATPIVLARRNVRLWATLTSATDLTPSAPAQRVAQYLLTHGASFFDELAAGSALLPTQAEEALVSCGAGPGEPDSFAGLRALLVPKGPAPRRRRLGRRRRLAPSGWKRPGASRTGRRARGGRAGERCGNRRARGAHAPPLGRHLRRRLAREADGRRRGGAASRAAGGSRRGDPRRALHRWLQWQVRSPGGDRAVAEARRREADGQMLSRRAPIRSTWSAS